MDEIRVFIIEEQAILRTGLKSVLQAEPTIRLVGEAPNANDAQAIASAQPDIVLMDLRMRDTDGTLTIRTVKQVLPQAKLLVLTAHTDEYVIPAVKAGADGYMVKDISEADLVQSIHAAARGKSPLHLSLAPSDSSDQPTDSAESKYRLTSRELDVLIQVAEGKSNAEIARGLYLSERTIKRDLNRIFGKLGVHGRAHAVAFAYQHQFI